MLWTAPSVAAAKLILGWALLLWASACAGHSVSQGDSASGASTNGGNAGSFGEPGSAGTLPGSGENGGNAASPNGGSAGLPFDNSEAAGPCGMYISPLKCEDPSADPSCAFDGTLPACTSLIDPNFPTYLQRGCGYLYVDTYIGEGDRMLRVYDEAAQRLVFESTTGARAVGCAIRGTRRGTKPQCDALVDLCAATGEGGAGGEGGKASGG